MFFNSRISTWLFFFKFLDPCWNSQSWLLILWHNRQEVFWSLCLITLLTEYPLGLLLWWAAFGGSSPTVLFLDVYSFDWGQNTKTADRCWGSGSPFPLGPNTRPGMSARGPLPWQGSRSCALLSLLASWLPRWEQAGTTSTDLRPQRLDSSPHHICPLGLSPTTPHFLSSLLPSNTYFHMLSSFSSCSSWERQANPLVLHCWGF